MFLPPELWEHVFSHITLHQLLPLERVSPTWNSIIKNYLGHRNLQPNMKGLVTDWYSKGEYQILAHFLEKRQYHYFKIAILLAAKMGLFTPVKIIYNVTMTKYKPKYIKTFDDLWGNTDIINQIYWKAVYHNQVAFLDEYLSWWGDWKFSEPQKPYSYEMAIWLHQHESPQYSKLFSYFIEKGDPKADDLIKDGIITKNDDYYFTLGKKGIIPDETNVWFLYGAAEVGNMELVMKKLPEYQKIYEKKSIYQICFYEKGITLLDLFTDQINFVFLMDAFNHQRLDICEIILEKHIKKIKFSNFGWNNLKLASYLLNNQKLAYYIKDSISYGHPSFEWYVIEKAGKDEINKIFESKIVKPGEFHDKLHRIAKRSLENFLIVYHKLPHYPCRILLRKGLYEAYAAIHPGCSCNETFLPKVIKHIPRLIPYFMKKKLDFDQYRRSHEIRKIVSPYHPNLYELYSCDLSDIKQLLVMGYVQKINPYEYYQHNSEMITWLRANNI